MEISEQNNYRTYLEPGENVQFKAVVESIDEGITFSDCQGNFLVYNPKMQEITGYTFEEANKSGDFTRLLYPDPLERQKAMDRIYLISEHKLNLPSEAETTIQAKDGEKKVLQVSTVAINFKNHDMFLTIYRDITRRKQQEEELNRLNLELKDLAIKDAHTGIYNYRYLIDRLTYELNRAKRYNSALSVLMIDIDYFKSINDVYGHQYGDKILKEFSQYLNSFCRSTDMVFRYGGEEFTVILTDTHETEAIQFGERLLNNTRRYLFDSKCNKIRIKMSIGLAGFPDDSDKAGSIDSLIAMADKALLKAKEMGGDRLFTVKMAAGTADEPADRNEKMAIKNLQKKIADMSRRINQSIIESIYAFAKTIEAKDYGTQGHSGNMVPIVIVICKEMNIPDTAIETLRHAAILHDLGKIGIPDNILQKPDKLTKDEYEIIKKHPQIGVDIIRPVHILKDLIPVILYHHEWFDGSGYPAGLKGTAIPLGARIVAVADVYQALISDRFYRKAYSRTEAIDIIKKNSGTQFDPQIVEIFIKLAG